MIRRPWKPSFSGYLSSLNKKNSTIAITQKSIASLFPIKPRMILLRRLETGFLREYFVTDQETQKNPVSLVLMPNTNLMWSCTYLDPPKSPLRRGTKDRNLVPPLLRGARGDRIWTLVSLHQQGAHEAELLRNYPGLSDRDLENAWRYYDRHRKEIDRIIVSHHTDD